MGNVKRKSRQRIEPPPLVAHWDAGEPPPAWAFEPGDHHDIIMGLYFFSEGNVYRSSIGHPHRDDWTRALQASKPITGDTPDPA